MPTWKTSLLVSLTRAAWIILLGGRSPVRQLLSPQRERRLDHESGEADAFYRSLQNSREPVRVGIDATGPIHWFERLLADLVTNFGSGTPPGFAPAKCASRKPMSATAHSRSTARQAFSENLGTHTGRTGPPAVARHRHKLVTLRTMLGNQLHFLAMSQGLCRKQKLFSKKGCGELNGLALGPWASRQREELLKLLDQLESPITELDRAVLEAAKHREDAVLLMTHPGELPPSSQSSFHYDAGVKRADSTGHKETPLWPL